MKTATAMILVSLSLAGCDDSERPGPTSSQSGKPGWQEIKKYDAELIYIAADGEETVIPLDDVKIKDDRVTKTVPITLADGSTGDLEIKFRFMGHGYGNAIDRYEMKLEGPGVSADDQWNEAVFYSDTRYPFQSGEYGQFIIQPR
ncbi:MAG TPA: hypothetical protein VMY42_08600 [Thermoguttaceae bacterium]|nr:hypothetical protein [Thermoguttaceae bacterium]